MLMLSAMMVLLLPTVLAPPILSRVLVTAFGTTMLLVVHVLLVRTPRRQKTRMRPTAVEQAVTDGESTGSDRAPDRPLLLRGR
jgi:hypothetical protein